MAHGNARLTLHGRRIVVDRVLGQGRPVSHVAKEMGISRQCASRWVNRYRREGEDGLRERSSRPHRCPTRTGRELTDKIVALRERERRGPDWLGAEAL